MSRLTVECSTCDNVEVLDTSASVSQRGTSFDINRRLVYSSNEMGGGYEGLAMQHYEHAMHVKNCIL